MRDPTTEVIDATVKMSPPAVVAFYTSILEMPIEKWVGVLTIIYMALQVYLLIRDRMIRRHRATDDDK